MKKLVVMGVCGCAAVLSGVGVRSRMTAQTDAKAMATMPMVFNTDELVKRGKAMLEKAKASPTGSVGETVVTYKSHYETLNVRVKSGGGELHAQWNDLLMVLDGEGTELTGGTMVDGKEAPGGETRGTRLDGATAHKLHKGDYIEIPAGTPHQQLVGPGQTLVVLAMKLPVAQ